MKKIHLPETDLELSAMGLGCVNAGLKWDGTDADRIFDVRISSYNQKFS